jgi:hypothetical protein
MSVSTDLAYVRRWLADRQRLNVEAAEGSPSTCGCHDCEIGFDGGSPKCCACGMAVNPETIRRSKIGWPMVPAEESGDPLGALDSIGTAPCRPRLTPRWTPLRRHSEQSRFFWSEKAWRILFAGRRGGKNELCKREVASLCWRDYRTQRAEEGRYALIAPTERQARRVWWRDLKKLIPTSWLAQKPNESELYLRMRWGSEIHVGGFDRPERWEGSPWDVLYIDEIANCRPDSIDAHIKPMLIESERMGRVVAMGVPDMDAPGQSQYERMHDLGANGDPDYDLFTWPSSDIQPIERIDRVRRTMDKNLADQELGGQFVKRGITFAPDFDRHLHVRETYYDPNRPIFWSLDFNIDNQASLIGQHWAAPRPDQLPLMTIYIHDELCVRAKTDTVVDAFFGRCQQREFRLENGVEIYGDASGIGRDSTSGQSDWFIIQNRLKNHRVQYGVLTSNHHIADTRNAVNAKIKNSAGEIAIYIHPRCTNLISNLTSASWPSDLTDEHWLAALRYFCMSAYPVTPDAPRRREQPFGFLPRG